MSVKPLQESILRSLAEQVACTRKAFVVATPKGVEEITREEWIEQMVEIWTDMDYRQVFDMVDQMNVRK